MDNRQNVNPNQPGPADGGKVPTRRTSAPRVRRTRRNSQAAGARRRRQTARGSAPYRASSDPVHKTAIERSLKRVLDGRPFAMGDDSFIAMPLDRADFEMVILAKIERYQATDGGADALSAWPVAALGRAIETGTASLLDDEG